MNKVWVVNYARCSGCLVSSNIFATEAEARQFEKECKDSGDAYCEAYQTDDIWNWTERQAMKKMRDHVISLGEHGVTILTHEGVKPLDGAFYDEAVALCKKYNIDCIGYTISVPDASCETMLAIWKNGHVDSGNAESIREIMKQEVFG